MCETGYEKLIAVTDRKLCRGDLAAQIEKVAALHPAGVILREKDLTPEEYRILAEKVLEICGREEVPCFLHSHVRIAKELGCRRIHLSYAGLLEAEEELPYFDEVSVSCHSEEEVKSAAEKGAGRIILGNIYDTACKPGKPGRGTAFLRQICGISSVPVYAIGGVTPERLPEILAAGAAGGCMMSGFMEL